MDANRQEIYEKLEATLTEHTYTAKDLMDFLNGFNSEDGSRLYDALTSHANDYLTETGVEVNYGKVIAETFRRTFFDHEASKRYPTNLRMDDKMLGQLVNYLTFSLAADRQATVHEAGSTRH